MSDEGRVSVLVRTPHRLRRRREWGPKVLSSRLWWSSRLLFHSGYNRRHYLSCRCRTERLSTLTTVSRRASRLLHLGSYAYTTCTTSLFPVFVPPVVGAPEESFGVGRCRGRVLVQGRVVSGDGSLEKKSLTVTITLLTNMSPR